MNAPHAEQKYGNAHDLASDWVMENFPDSIFNNVPRIKSLRELLLTVWNQSAAKHNRASDTWYEEEENTYMVTLTPVEFNVTLPPTDINNQTLPGEDKK